MFGSCIIRILNTVCAKIWRKKSGAKGLPGNLAAKHQNMMRAIVTQNLFYF
jgi:hypothetical protein